MLYRLLLLFFLSALSVSLVAQDDSLRFKNYEYPSYSIGGSSYYYHEYSSKHITNERDVIKPIGLSDSMYLAYLVVSQVKCNCFFFEVHIRDMKNDSIVWSLKYINDKDAEFISDTTIIECDDSKSAWFAYYDTIANALEKYKINQPESFYQVSDKRPDYEDTEFVKDSSSVDSTVCVTSNLLFDDNQDTTVHYFEIPDGKFLTNYSFSAYITHPVDEEQKILFYTEKRIDSAFPKESITKVHMYYFKHIQSLNCEIKQVLAPSKKEYSNAKNYGFYIYPYQLKELQGDMITNITNEESWMDEYGSSLHYDYFLPDSTNIYNRFLSKAKYRDKIRYNKEEYQSHFAIRFYRNTLYFFGQKDENDQMKSSLMVRVNRNDSEKNRALDLTNLLEINGQFQDIIYADFLDSTVLFLTGNSSSKTSSKMYVTAYNSNTGELMYQLPAFNNTMKTFQMRGKFLFCGTKFGESSSISVFSLENGQFIEKYPLKSDPVWITYSNSNLQVKCKKGFYEYSLEFF